MTAFADLHVPGDPFVLANAWDLGTARSLAAAGFAAIGTTSLGVAASHGLVDGVGGTKALTLELVHSLVASDLGCPVTADLENGFSDDPREVAELVAGLGVDGVNLEDSDHGRLVDPAVHVARIAAVKAAAPDVFVNARTDVYWSGSKDLEETIARLQAYVDAGADGVFVPGELDPAVIEQVTSRVPAPLNLLASPRRDRRARLAGSRPDQHGVPALPRRTPRRHRGGDSGPGRARLPRRDAIPGSAGAARPPDAGMRSVLSPRRR